MSINKKDTIKNNTSFLVDQNYKLNRIKNGFGDVNFKMITAINGVNGILEGERSDKNRIEVINSANTIKNSILVIEDTMRYLNELNQALDDYLKCQFNEV